MALICVFVLTCAVAGVLVHGATHPAKVRDGRIDFDSMRMAVEEVEFESPDGVGLAGWLLPGRARGPGVVLCHDRGRSKASMLNLMIRLHELGCTTLAFDFRGHGESEGRASTLGLHEGRDVSGAIELLVQRSGLERGPIGLYGVGMGAHAAVLAAADRPRIRVLVLDGLYPDVGYALNRQVFGNWQSGRRYLGFITNSLFEMTMRSSISGGRADELLSGLAGRHVLLVSPGDDAQLAAEIQRMYELIPRTRDTDGSLITLPVTQTRDLYGEEVDRYHSRVAEFFRDRLVEVETVARR